MYSPARYGTVCGFTSNLSLSKYNTVQVKIKFSHFITDLIWASTRENPSLGSANNKSADQPAHPGSLISACVIRLLESIISRLNTSEYSNF